jgi:hypothetical protein
MKHPETSPFSPNYRGVIPVEPKRGSPPKPASRRAPAGFDRSPIHLGKTTDSQRSKAGAILKSSGLG